MNAIRNISMTVLFLSVTALFSLNAQPKPRNGHGNEMRQGNGPDSCKVQMRVKKMSEKLGLTEKQEAELLSLHFSQFEELKKLYSEKSNDCEADKEARMALHEKFNEAAMEILSKEQYGEYRAMRANQKHRGKHNGGHSNHPRK